MVDQRERSGGLDRRRFVTSLAAGSAAGLATTGVAAAGCDDMDADHHFDEDDVGRSEKTYWLCQGHEKVKLTPITGPVDAETFYGWDLEKYSSKGTLFLQREDTSVCFLYEDPQGRVYLFVIHGKLGGDSDGGSATFEFQGLWRTGSWVVDDDRYEGENNYDRWDTSGDVHTVDWTWAGGRTDGGAYGPLGLDPYVRIDPSFNEGAALHDEYYDGTVTDWEVLSASWDGIDRHGIDMTEPAYLLHNPITGRDLGDWWERKKREWRDERDHSRKDRHHDGRGHHHEKKESDDDWFDDLFDHDDDDDVGSWSWGYDEDDSKGGKNRGDRGNGKGWHGRDNDDHEKTEDDGLFGHDDTDDDDDGLLGLLGW